MLKKIKEISFGFSSAPYMDVKLEQSKIPKEEHCKCSCHQGYLSTNQPHGDHLEECYKVYHQPKTESISIEKGRELVKKIQAKTEDNHRWFCSSLGTEPADCNCKTEDTGECKNCGGKGYNTVFTGIRISPDFIGDVEYNEKPKINKVPCRICKGTGVSKEATNEDSCDTLSPSENKEESMEDRFDEKMQHYTDGKTEFGYKGDGIKGFWLRSGMDGEIDSDKVKDFIQSEISKAVAKEREELIENLPNKKIPKDKLITLYGKAKIHGWNEYRRKVLSLLNSKKGQHE